MKDSLINLPVGCWKCMMQIKLKPEKSKSKVHDLSDHIV